MSFLGEIKRREVFQAARLYAVASWFMAVPASAQQPVDMPVLEHRRLE